MMKVVVPRLGPELPHTHTLTTALLSPQDQHYCNNKLSTVITSCKDMKVNDVNKDVTVKY